MKDFTQLAADAGVSAPIVLPIPTAADPTTFPGTIPAETGALLLAMERSALTGSEDDESAEIGITPEAYARMEADLLGPEGVKRLADLGIVGVMRQHVISVLAVWHLAGPEFGAKAWDMTPGTVGKGLPREKSPKTAGQSSKAATSGRTPSKGRTSATRAGGASSAPRKATRAARTA